MFQSQFKEDGKAFQKKTRISSQTESNITQLVSLIGNRGMLNYASGIPIQRLGETEAIDLSRRLKRGNVSISKRMPDSASKKQVDEAREEEIEQAWIVHELQGAILGTDFALMEDRIKLAEISYLINEVGVANCEEFAKFTVGYLIQNTQNQFVCKCSFALGGTDHAFTMTSLKPLRTGSLGRIDESMLVIDVWAGNSTPVSVAEYLRDNPYCRDQQQPMSPSEIWVDEVYEADGQPLVSERRKAELDNLAYEIIERALAIAVKEKKEPLGWHFY